MQAVICAAGRGSRMKNLTVSVPKPLIEVGGKTLLEHKLLLLPDEVDEVVFVVGYLGNTIMERFGNGYEGRKVTYVWEPEAKGTGYALWKAQSVLKDRFLVLMGDDIYSASDMKKCVEHEWSILVHESSEDEVRAGRVLTTADGTLHEITEGTHKGPGVLVNTGLYTLTTKIFEYDLVKIPGKDEYGLPQTIVTAARDVPISIIKSESWIQVNSPEDLEIAEKIVKKIS